MTDYVFTVDDFKNHTDEIEHTFDFHTDLGVIKYIKDRYPSTSLMILRGIQLGMFLSKYYK